MRRCLQAMVVVVVLLALGSLALAQQTPQPVVRMGNWIEVGNDVFMHIIANMDARYKTSHNADFESETRDRALSRSPTSTAQHEQEGDLFYAELRFGAEFRYQKSLYFQLLFENQSVFDGSLIDDRANTSNPGGTDVFGRNASTENPGFRVERFFARYTFPSTPLTLHVGADLWGVSQAGLVQNDNPRIGLEAKFGDLRVYASAVVERESQRLGLQNDNDTIYYVFGGVYDWKPHRFGMDVVWFRDRFSGADTQAVGFRGVGGDVGWTGQKIDSVWINASWSGKVGPVRGLLQGNVLLGTARGATVRGAGATALPADVPLGKSYDIFAGSAVAYVEATFGPVTPFVGFVYGSGDGDPGDDKLQGFQTQPFSDSTGITTNGFMDHLDTATSFAGRDYSCPGYATGIPARIQGVPGNRSAVGAQALGIGAATECAHTVTNFYNSRFGTTSHSGISVHYSNPGTFLIPAGLKVNPLKGHQLAGWYVYRGIVDARLLELALAPELAGRGLRKTVYHGIGGNWQWTLNPNFDIRLSGEIAVPGSLYKDLASLADCDPRTTGRQSCDGNDPALRAEARFRARF